MILNETICNTFNHHARSNKRTNILHDLPLTILKDKYPNLSWEVENRVPDAYGKTFTLDIAGIDKNNRVEYACLVKMVNNNFAQNANNYGNTSIAEWDRLAFSPDPPKTILFLNFYPEESPYFDQTGALKRWDVVANTKADVKNILNQKAAWKNIRTIEHTVWFYYNKLNVSNKLDLGSAVSVLNEEKQYDELVKIL
tara:strand:- start:1552 stop:2142 length:591 start_codon:yes stop_codon:yes gene_type:complete